MPRFFRIVLKILLVIAIASIIFVLMSRWHVSEENHAKLLKDFHVLKIIKDACVKNGINVNWMPNLPIVVLKERLGILDALINALSLFVFITTITPLVLLLIIYFVFNGIFTANWSSIILGVLAVIALLLYIFVVPFVFWFIMFFQPCTPGYVITWLVLGLPFICGAFYTEYYVIIILIPK